MRDVYVVGIHTTPFGKHMSRSVKDLAQETTLGCLADAGLDKARVQALWFANSGWGTQAGQDCIRGQVALRAIGIEDIPITNVENACASGSTAFHHAWLGIASGLYDVTMAVGAEKLYMPNRMMTLAGFLGGIDVENALVNMRALSVLSLSDEDRAAIADFRLRWPETPPRARRRRGPVERLRERLRETRDTLAVAVTLGEKMGYGTVRELGRNAGGDHSPFMDIYGFAARRHMREYGLTVEQLAAVASKAHHNGSLNPNAQYRFEASIEDVLRDRLVSWPLTRAMCAPIGDGASSAILCSDDVRRRLAPDAPAIRVRASLLGSGRERPEGGDIPEIGERLARRAYEAAGVGPADIHLAEVHDATSFGEIVQAENLGFCARGEGGRLAESGATALGGRIPINPSGGLTSRGHPVGASGLAQLHELCLQLRGAAGPRQVVGARLAMAENGGGALGNEEAAMGIHILEALNP